MRRTVSGKTGSLSLGTGVRHLTVHEVGMLPERQTSDSATVKSLTNSMSRLVFFITSTEIGKLLLKLEFDKYDRLHFCNGEWII